MFKTETGKRKQETGKKNNFFVLKIILFLLLFLIFTQILFAQNEALQKIYADLAGNYKTITTFQADFEQINFWKELAVEKKSLGKIFYNKNFLLLKYSEPKGQRMLIDTLAVTVYDSTSNQALISDKIDTELRPDKFIALYWNDAEKKILENTPDFSKVELISETGEKIVVEIENNLIVGFTFFDDAGNYVKYEFRNIVLNKSISAEIFQMNLPKDVNIIDRREF